MTVPAQCGHTQTVGGTPMACQRDDHPEAPANHYMRDSRLPGPRVRPKDRALQPGVLRRV